MNKRMVPAEILSKAAQLKAKREEKKDGRKKDKEIPAVSAGAIDKVIDFTFNPSREKIREVTYIDPIQARLLPQLDVINDMIQFCIEIAFYRQDANAYQEIFEQDQPVPPEAIGDFIYRMAQWNKSVRGANLKSAVDITLAEMETRSEEREYDHGGFGEE